MKRTVWLKDIVDHVFSKLGIDPSRIRINQELFRPTEIEDIFGNSGKAKKQLNWNYNSDFFTVLDKILEAEEKNYGKEQ